MNIIRKHKILLILLAILIAGGAGGYKYYQVKKTQEAVAATRTDAVQRGNLRKTISATGALKALDNVDINSKITGRIVAVYVTENQHVTAGQALVKLDDTSLKATQEMKRATLADKKATYDRDTALLDQGAIAQSVFDTAEAEYWVAQAEYDQATSNVGDTVISTPIDGYVIGKPTPVGQTVSSGISTPQVLMSVANLDKMQIYLMVDESDIGQIKQGQNVEFTVDAYPTETFKGTVTLIGRSATTTNNVNYYTVYVDVENSEGKLLPTMTARANVIVDEMDNVLTVANKCLHTEDGQQYVLVYDKKNNTSRKVPVKVLLAGTDRTAVEADLQEGEELVVKTTKATSTGNNRRMGPPM
ncbi:MAG: efflux RND transporter periplasmic adaptor subunit [Acidaminococcus sp.]|uniref:efflux RND transporter periplasmic adaptor subunit n=1 Tax=Acidaminococcus sp. TaxID=1872103 RepID=UPI0026DF18F0|nr:efflux RND transporter periplasmic adaptor subunit [Acidaminococcus sp.]MDO5597441.1 efflux RND transporter periplasmic adaptor subunit [Acidaminococcus sp.]